ncbi:MAG: RIP metalloprotease RseP [Betaproteobacteria bacterium]|nr:RIP metalloprotease RseP [Betaproteobacteria bacterium]MBK9609591.1 RIP metalloprotease RseP [Betaproteobacteria bacterium]
MIAVVQTVAAFLLTIGLLVTFHEFGHYLAGRLLGVKVLRFSIGFGKPLFLRRFGRDRTEFVVAAIPLGGFVRFLDEREAAEGEVITVADSNRAFNRQKVWKRLIIVAAGPFANLLLAVLLYAGLYLNGVDGLRAVLAAPPAATAAAQAGFADRDEIVALDGRPLESWQELRWRLLRVSGEAGVELRVRRGGETLARTLDLKGLSAADWEGPFLDTLGLRLYLPAAPPAVMRVLDGRAGAAAGLAAGDIIVAIDDHPLTGVAEARRIIAAHPDQAVRLTLTRAGQTVALSATPEAKFVEGKTIGQLGIDLGPNPTAFAAHRVRTQYGIADALARGVQKTWELSVFSLKMLGRIVIGEASLKNISGPLTVADYAGQSAQQGVTTFILYLAVISISLGVLNLLPIPLLDGGHLLYYTVELLKGSPLSDRTLQLGQQAGMFLLAALMALALYNDLFRLLPRIFS